MATYFGQVSFDLFSALIVDLLRLRLSLLLLISLLPSLSLGSRVSLLSQLLLLSGHRSLFLQASK